MLKVRFVVDLAHLKLKDMSACKLWPELSLHKLLLNRAKESHILLPACFTFDIFCHKTSTFDVELIELNTFGAQMSAGSCLFDHLAAKVLIFKQSCAKCGMVLMSAPCSSHEF